MTPKEFREGLKLENFIKEEIRKVATDKTLSNKQKQEQLHALNQLLIDYRIAYKLPEIEEAMRNNDMERWDK